MPATPTASLPRVREQWYSTLSRRMSAVQGRRPTKANQARGKPGPSFLHLSGIRGNSRKQDRLWATTEAFSRRAAAKRPDCVMGPVHIGTSGWHYKHWCGPFYPEKYAAAKMLPFYLQHFDTVEINNSFYR